jgi:Zn-dependent protease
VVFGGSSIQLARVFGVRIGVDASWFFVLFLIIWSLSGYYGDLFPDEGGKSFALAVVSALLFFLSVVLHELGHALVAMRNGIGISGIDLWLFGGVAKMTRDTGSAAEEFKVAVAGPVVTLIIAAFCFALGVLIGGGDDTLRGAQFETGALGATEAVLGYLAFVNAALLVFNLIPGFPLDGGRIARAIAWWRTGDRARATRFAARLGRGFSYLLIGLGIFLFLQGSLIGGVWMVFVGLFLGQAARSAELQTDVTSRIEGLRVADVMDAEPVAVPVDATLERTLDEFFFRYRWPWFPVIGLNGRLIGLVSREAAEGVPEPERSTRTVQEVMASDRDTGVRVGIDEPLEALLGLEALQRLGAIMAVDRDGVLRGIVTIDQVRRALRPIAS